MEKRYSSHGYYKYQHSAVCGISVSVYLQVTVQTIRVSACFITLSLYIYSHFLIDLNLCHLRTAFEVYHVMTMFLMFYTSYMDVNMYFRACGTKRLHHSVFACWFFSIIWATTWQNQQNECAPSEDSDQPGHPQWVAKDPSFLHADSEDWSDWADDQADLSLHWVHSHFVSFVMSWLIFFLFISILFIAILLYIVKIWTDSSRLRVIVLSKSKMKNLDPWKNSCGSPWFWTVVFEPHH